MQYQELSNTKPLVFDGVMDPNISMRWISDVEGCFYMCSCADNLKVKFALNLLRLGVKD